LYLFRGSFAREREKYVFGKKEGNTGFESIKCWKICGNRLKSVEK